MTKPDRSNTNSTTQINDLFTQNQYKIHTYKYHITYYSGRVKIFNRHFFLVFTQSDADILSDPLLKFFQSQKKGQRTLSLLVRKRKVLFNGVTELGNTSGCLLKIINCSSEQRTSVPSAFLHEVFSVFFGGPSCDWICFYCNPFRSHVKF